MSYSWSDALLCFGHALSQSTNLFPRAMVVWRVVVEGHEERLFALKDSCHELCRKPEYSCTSVPGSTTESWRASLESLDLGENESSHRTCSATFRVGEHSGQHNHSHMRTLTYPIGQKLATFMSTKQLVVALRTAIEGLVLFFFFFLSPFALLINSQTIEGHRFTFASGVLHRDISSGNISFTDQLNCGGFLHDPDYSEVVLMPEDKVEEDSVQQISRRLKDMMVSGIYCISNAVKQFLTKALINSWRLMYWVMGTGGISRREEAVWGCATSPFYLPQRESQ
jgi:hypothetical protein